MGEEHATDLFVPVSLCLPAHLIATEICVGTPPVLPVLLLTDLAGIVRRGRKIGLAASSHDAYVLARDALMLLLDDSGGRA